MFHVKNIGNSLLLKRGVRENLCNKKFMILVDVQSEHFEKLGYTRSRT